MLELRRGTEGIHGIPYGTTCCTACMRAPGHRTAAGPPAGAHGSLRLAGGYSGRTPHFRKAGVKDSPVTYGGARPGFNVLCNGLRYRLAVTVCVAFHFEMPSVG